MFLSSWTSLLRCRVIFGPTRQILFWIWDHPLWFMTYISNRVSKIQTILPDAIWDHVPGFDNPADCASQWISSLRLESQHLWWAGPPKWLQLSTFWPSPTGSIYLKINREERVVTQASTVELDPPSSLPRRYSTFTNSLRTAALCLKFIDQLR